MASWLACPRALLSTPTATPPSLISPNTKPWIVCRTYGVCSVSLVADGFLHSRIFAKSDRSLLAFRLLYKPRCPIDGLPFDGDFIDTGVMPVLMMFLSLYHSEDGETLPRKIRVRRRRHTFTCKTWRCAIAACLDTGTWISRMSGRLLWYLVAVAIVGFSVSNPGCLPYQCRRFKGDLRSPHNPSLVHACQKTMSQEPTSTFPVFLNGSEMTGHQHSAISPSSTGWRSVQCPNYPTPGMIMGSWLTEEGLVEYAIASCDSWRYC
jgi:hypothetical protein